MNDEWIPWNEGREIANSNWRGKDGAQWAKTHGVPIMQATKHGRVFVSKLACEKLGMKVPPELELKPSTQHTCAEDSRTADVSCPKAANSSETHPEFYDIHIKVTVSHDFLRAIFSKG